MNEEDQKKARQRVKIKMPDEELIQYLPRGVYEERLLKTLIDNSMPTFEEINNLTVGDKGSLLRALNNLVREGKVRKTQLEQKGKPKAYFINEAYESK